MNHVMESREVDNDCERIVQATNSLQLRSQHSGNVDGATLANDVHATKLCTRCAAFNVDEMFAMLPDEEVGICKVADLGDLSNEEV